MVLSLELIDTFHLWVLSKQFSCLALIFFSYFSVVTQGVNPNFRKNKKIMITSLGVQGHVDLDKYTFGLIFG